METNSSSSAVSASMENRYNDPQAPVGSIVSGSFIKERVVSGLIPVATISLDSDSYDADEAFELIWGSEPIDADKFVVGINDDDGTVNFIREDGKYISVNNGERSFYAK
jgi:hypothetical protein